MEKYDVDIAGLRRELEASSFPSGGVVDRQHLAVALSELSRAYGNIVDCYLAFYRDNEEIAAECYSSVAYISSLYIFEMEGECVLPEKMVLDNEISVYVLRFFENTL